MKRAPLYVFVAMTAGAALYLAVTTTSLPESVATKFYGGDRVGSVMSRSTYLWFMLALTIGIPSLIALALGWLPAWTERGTNLPNRNYWFAPERRVETLDYLRTHACWMGSLTAGFMFATHAFILQAHTHLPPQPQLWPFSVIAVVFVVAALAWALTLYMRLKRAPR